MILLLLLVHVDSPCSIIWHHLLLLVSILLLLVIILLLLVIILLRLLLLLILMLLSAAKATTSRSPQRLQLRLQVVRAALLQEDRHCQILLLSVARLRD